MIIELNLANLIFIIIAIIGAFWALAKTLMSQYSKSLCTRLDLITNSLEGQQRSMYALEREFLLLQSSVPREYLRRDDFGRELKALHDAVQREILPLRQSQTRIEDFLLNNKGGM